MRDRLRLQEDAVQPDVYLASRQQIMGNWQAGLITEGEAAELLEELRANSPAMAAIDDQNTCAINEVGLKQGPSQAPEL